MNEVQKNKILPAWLCILIFMVGLAVISGILSLLMGIFLTPVMPTLKHITPMANYLLMEFWMLIAVVIMSIVLLRFGENKSFAAIGFNFEGRTGDFLMGFVVAFFILGSGFYFLYSIHAIRIEHFHFYKQSFFFSLVLFALVAITEEIMMRGYILGRLLRTNMNKYWALIISALLFSSMHCFNNSVSFLPLFNIFLAGLLLGATYIYTKNLCYPISFHLFWNFIQGPILGFNVSGNMKCSTLLTTKITGSTFLTGGNFGFEGSIICIVLNIIFIALTIWVMENKYSKKTSVE